jgi:hypothetical protein
MKRFIQGEHRGQSTLLPESLDDYASDTNPVRVVDGAFDHRQSPKGQQQSEASVASLWRCVSSWDCSVKIWSPLMAANSKP